MKQTTFPAWWTDLKISDRQREQIRARFTISRDGYTCWHAGRCVFVCGKRTHPAEIEAKWKARQATIEAIDKGETIAAAIPSLRTYRSVLGEFLTIQAARVGAARKAIEERTLHNKVSALNAFGRFKHRGRKIADMGIRDIGPEQFTAYAATWAGWKASGYDSIVCLVGELFRWAEKMEYIDRFRPGPEFVRPGKKLIRSERLDLKKSFTPAEVAAAYIAANPTVRCWIALGICAAFNNSDIAHLSRDVIHPESGVIDFRRRKTGKIRRVIPLPPDVVELLRNYVRPEADKPEWDNLFFLSVEGLPYSRTKSRNGKFMPQCSISRMFGDLLKEAGVNTVAGRNFSGLRTTFYNMAPGGEWETERRVIMGRASGTVDYDSYLESVGLDRLRHVVNSVWGRVKTAIETAKAGQSPV